MPISCLALPAALRRRDPLTPINTRMSLVSMYRTHGKQAAVLPLQPAFAGIRSSLIPTLTFSLQNFANGVVSKVLPNAPAGMIFGGDTGLPKNQYSQNKLANFDPRIGLVWDPHGDGRMSIRAGYGIFYDFPSFAFDQFG